MKKVENHLSQSMNLVLKQAESIRAEASIEKRMVLAAKFNEAANKLSVSLQEAFTLINSKKREVAALIVESAEKLAAEVVSLPKKQRLTVRAKLTKEQTRALKNGIGAVLNSHPQGITKNQLIKELGARGLKASSVTLNKYLLGSDGVGKIIGKQGLKVILGLRDSHQNKGQNDD